MKFEISDVKYLVKFGAKTFDLPGKHKKLRGRIPGQSSAKFSEASFQSSRLFFGNFVQQKGGVKRFRKNSGNKTETPNPEFLSSIRLRFPMPWQAKEISYTRAVPEVQGDEILTFGE